MYRLMDTTIFYGNEPQSLNADIIDTSFLNSNGNETSRMKDVLGLLAAATPNGGDKLGVDNMDDNKMLELHLNKIESDSKELKTDMRTIEKRMDDRLNRIEDMVKDQNKQFDEKFDKILNKIDSFNDKMDLKVSNLDAKIDTKYTMLDNKIDNLDKEIKTNHTELVRFWIGIGVSIVVGLGSIIVAWIK